jgi:hypothetical protein
MGFKRNVDKKSGPITMQKSLSPKRESRNPRQTICEFRKFATSRGNNEKSRAHPRLRQPHQLSLQRIESNPLAQPKTTFNPN